MTRKKMWPGAYGWSAVVLAYMGNSNVPCLDAVCIMNPATDKAQEAIYAQLVAMEWGIA